MAQILLGVSAGIAAYKAADIASSLTQSGHRVVVLMTPGATKFITPLTFRAVTRQRVYTDTFEDVPDASTEHVSLAQGADAFLIAPATADLVARMASGMGNDIVTTTLLAHDGPVVVAPSMNDKMWANPVVRRNIATLRQLGHRIVEPDSGHLACGSFGPGRLAAPETILAALQEALSSPS